MVKCDKMIALSLKAMGLSKLKDKQEAILAFLWRRDVFVSLPTGYGKSIIYGVLPLVFDHYKDIIWYYYNQTCHQLLFYFLLSLCWHQFDTECDRKQISSYIHVAYINIIIMNIISSLAPTKFSKNLVKLLTNASTVGWPDPSFVVGWVWLRETMSLWHMVY